VSPSSRSRYDILLVAAHGCPALRSSSWISRSSGTPAAATSSGVRHPPTNRPDRLTRYSLDRAVRSARNGVKGLPEGFRFCDLGHYLASLLIAAGADVKVVQARLRHASAKTTLDTYGRLWPDADESTRAAVSAVLAARADSLRTDAGSAG
jgi:integrase